MVEFRLLMAQVLLDAADVDAGLQQMSGIGMAQGMDGDAFFNLSCFNTRRKAP